MVLFLACFSFGQATRRRSSTALGAESFSVDVLCPRQRIGLALFFFFWGGGGRLLDGQS